MWCPSWWSSGGDDDVQMCLRSRNTLGHKRNRGSKLKQPREIERKNTSVGMEAKWCKTKDGQKLLDGPCAWSKWGPCARGLVCTGCARSGRKASDPWGFSKVRQFRGFGRWGSRKMGRSTCQTPNSWIKTTKSHKIQQIARNFFGAIFVGIFEFGRKTTKSS